MGQSVTAEQATRLAAGATQLQMVDLQPVAIKACPELAVAQVDAVDDRAQRELIEFEFALPVGLGAAAAQARVDPDLAIKAPTQGIEQPRPDRQARQLGLQLAPQRGVGGPGPAARARLRPQELGAELRPGMPQQAAVKVQLGLQLLALQLGTKLQCFDAGLSASAGGGIGAEVDAQVAAAAAQR
ncbi:MAG: hypothetical protein JM57_11615 [Comamonadaceae bacterium BICA1-1]|nr:MAG: hypothetical protein JM57_11615 [Comamonadaceae bacterium BICA1-1]